MNIPWIAVGPTVKPGYTIQRAVSLIDTTPTLARMLGIAPHEEWEGTCVDELFV
jgi:arylsulfatase A-like enzyme